MIASKIISCVHEHIHLRGHIAYTLMYANFLFRYICDQHTGFFSLLLLLISRVVAAVVLTHNKQSSVNSKQ